MFEYLSLKILGSSLVIFLVMIMYVGTLPVTSFADEYLSPAQQIKSGVALENIQCKENRVLVLRTNGSPVCLSEKTSQKMSERFGWEIIAKQETIEKDSSANTKAKYSVVITKGNIISSDPRIEDSFGTRLTEVYPQRSVQVSADITNRGDTTQQFEYRVTVTDEKSDAVKNSISAELEPEQMFTGSTMWTPQEHGKYVIDIVVLDDIASQKISDTQQMIVTIDNVGGSIKVTGEMESGTIQSDTDSMESIKKFFEENTVKPIAYENPREFAEKLVAITDDKILEEKEFRNGIHFYTEKGRIRIQFSEISSDADLPTYFLKNQHAIKHQNGEEFVNNFMEKMGYHRDGTELETWGNYPPYFQSFQTHNDIQTEMNRIVFYFEPMQTVIHIGSWHNNINSLELPITLDEVKNTAYKYASTNQYLQDPNGYCHLKKLDLSKENYYHPEISLFNNNLEYIIDLGYCQNQPTIGSIPRIGIIVDVITGEVNWKNTN